MCCCASPSVTSTRSKAALCPHVVPPSQASPLICPDSFAEPASPGSPQSPTASLWVCEPDGSLDLMISLHMGKWDCNGCIFWPVSTLQGWTDTEADLSSMSSRPASRQVSCDISKDTAEIPDFKPCNSSSFKSKLKSHDSGIFEKVTSQAERITYVESIKGM